MKKILLAIMLLTIGLSASGFEENKKACDGGNVNSCNNLGVMYEKGKEVKQDSFKAVELYTTACDAGHAMGCSNLGAMYDNGYRL